MPKLTKKAFRALLDEWLAENDAMTCEMEDGDGRSFLVHEEDGMIYVD